MVSRISAVVGVQARQDGLGIISHVKSQRSLHKLKSVKGLPKPDRRGDNYRRRAADRTLKAHSLNSLN